MLRDEAQLMGEWVLGLNLPPGSVALNIGSSTRKFREETQPYISSLLIEPAKSNGIRWIHCDMKAADGVDEEGDLLEVGVQQRLARYNADLIICSNLLEHLSDPGSFAKACGTLVRPGGHALFTVPLSFPYHPDPIDTMLRLRATQLAALLPEWEAIRTAEICAGSFWQEVREGPQPATKLLRTLIRVAMPIYRPARWRPAAHQLLWLFRSYKVSLALLRRPLG